MFGWIAKLFGCPQDQNVPNECRHRRRYHITSFLLDHLSKKSALLKMTKIGIILHFFSLFFYRSSHSTPFTVYSNKFIWIWNTFSFHLICVYCTSMYGFRRWDSIFTSKWFKCKWSMALWTFYAKEEKTEKKPPP